MVRMTESSLTLFMIFSFLMFLFMISLSLCLVGMARCSLNFFHNFFILDLFFPGYSNFLPKICSSRLRLRLRLRSVLLAVNASFYERVARLTKSVFPSVNLLSFFVSMMVKSTSGGSSSSQEAVFLILDV
jgi:hypothetical protein